MTDHPLNEMPEDPFGPPEEMLAMMKGISHIYNAAIISGLPEHVATQFIIGVFCSLVQSTQTHDQPEVPPEEEIV